MEPVVFPTTIAPVIETDRVKRSTAREDSGGGSGFARYLRKKRDPQSGSREPAEKDRQDDAESQAGEGETDSAARRQAADEGEAQKPGGRLIDVRA